MNTSDSLHADSPVLPNTSVSSPNATGGPADTAATPANADGPVAKPASIKLKHLSRMLHVPARWHILRELAKGEALPVNELARRAKCPAATVSKHMALLKKAGVVQVGYGRLYKLTPGFQPEPGGQRLDLGHCVLKLDSGW